MCESPALLAELALTDAGQSAELRVFLEGLFLLLRRAATFRHVGGIQLVLEVSCSHYGNYLEVRNAPPHILSHMIFLCV